MTGGFDLLMFYSRPNYLPSCVLKRRQYKFISLYSSTVNGFCQFYNKL